MNKKLYALMDWAKIEEIVYGECDRPCDFLGAHTAGRQTLIQAFLPGAESVSVYLDGAEGAKGRTVKSEIVMEKADEAGFFACVLPGTDQKKYRFHAEYPAAETADLSVTEEDGAEGKKAKKTAGKAEKIIRELRDPYGTARILTEKEEQCFLSGGDRQTDACLGAHKKTVAGVRGVVFRVWAPNARRVSVVGGFNHWNGLENPMNRLPESGIFELFLPGVEEGTAYAYEILMQGGSKMSKADPYAISIAEADGRNVSIVEALPAYKWKDEKWLEKRKKTDPFTMPVNIYELSLMKMPEGFLQDAKAVGQFAAYVKSMGYTHVQLMPVMEYPAAEDAGYHASHFFAPAARFGTAAEYMRFVDTLHKEGVGVLLAWAPGDFSNVDYGLGYFDGTALYEYADPRRGTDPRTGMLQFNLGSPMVREYLLSVISHWIQHYHLDGITTLDAASMLYLDYYRQPGEWVPNMYGSVENLETMAFFREMNAMLHKRAENLISIAAETSGFSHVTGTDEEGLGFDFTTDVNFVREFIDYLGKDPIERHAWHYELTGSTLYQYCERYILPVDVARINFRQGGLIGRMNGSEELKWRNLKLFYGYLMAHVGRKSIFMGQEYGSYASFEDMPHILPGEEQDEVQEHFRAYMRSLNTFYAKTPAFYAAEDAAEGFAWINDHAIRDNVLALIRSDGKKKNYFCVFNFANAPYEKYRVGTAWEGKYHEVFTSEAGAVDGPTIAAHEGKADGQEMHIRVDLAPLSFRIFEYIPYSAEEKAEIRRREEERRARKAAEEEQRRRLTEERARIRSSLKQELEKKIAAAEAAIAGGSEYKAKDRRNTGKP
ncbi:MAG: 1,4-alpha-glucan branching enzyme [Lachnospiraceae bacterium]|nr:1,4-alpha-glucan branching enzyme [Lachnospiraceae bacterium]